MQMLQLGLLVMGSGWLGAAGIVPDRAISAVDAGFLPDRDLGSDGDLFLDFDNGDDANSGTSASQPVKGVTRWKALNPAGKTTRVRGFLQGSIDLTDLGGSSALAPTRVLGWGQDKFTLSGADPVTGWTACASPADDTALGSALAASGKIWKKEFNTLDFADVSGPLAANLFQNGEKLNIATAKAVRSILQEVDVYTANWLVAASTQSPSASTFTVTIASPAVVTLNSHGLLAGMAVVPQTTGALPTGLTAGTTYYVHSIIDANSFRLMTTAGGTTALNTSGSQSGTHSLVRPLIQSYTLPPDLQGAGYSLSDFADVNVLQHIFGNAEAVTAVSSVSGDTITLANLNGYDPTNPFKDNFALQNFLREMRSGEWGFRKDSPTAGRTTIYVWPLDDQNGSGMAIDVTTRGIGFKMGGTGCNASLNSYYELGGFVCSRQSTNGAATDENIAISFGGIPSSGGPVKALHRTDIYLHDFKVCEVWRPDRAYSHLWGQYADKVTIQRYHIKDAYNAFGVFMLGDPYYGDQCSGLRILDGIIEDVSNSGIRLMAQTGYVIGRNRLINGGVGDHANQWNPYVVSSNGVMWGCLTEGYSGYGTWGDSDPPDVAFCWLDSSYTPVAGSIDARALEDQNNNYKSQLTKGMLRPAWNALSLGNPVAPPCWYSDTPITVLSLNNNIAPNSDNANSAGYGVSNLGSQIAQYQGSYKYKVMNNVGSGFSFKNNIWVDTFLSNLSTKAASPHFNGVTSPDASNMASPNSVEYGDIAANDLSAPPGAIRRTKAGFTTQDITADIAALKARFPDLAAMFDYDLAGRRYDKANPPLGPFVNVDDKPAYRPQYRSPPTLSGAHNVGLSYGLNPPTVGGYPKPALTYQWYKLADPRDRVSKVAISGATSATSPAWVSGDIGSYPALEITATNSAGSRKALVVSPLAVTNTAPAISAPDITIGSAVAKATGSSSNANQSIVVTSTGKPLVLVIASWGVTLSTLVGWSVTVDGTPMTLKSAADMIQSNTQVAVFLLTGLSVGSHTITMSPAATNYFAMVARAMEIGGATDLIPGTTVKTNSSSSVRPSVTPSFGGGAVLHVCARGGGDIAVPSNPVYPVNVTTGEPLVCQEKSGTSGVSDVTLTVAFEQSQIQNQFCDAGFASGGSPPPTNRQYASASFAIKP